MTDLIKRVEAATEGSRELDADVTLHEAKRDYPEARFIIDKDGNQMDWIQLAPGLTGSDFPAYTSRAYDLTAAMTLVPEEWETERISFLNEDTIVVNIRRDGHTIYGYGRTPALALTAAALKAREIDNDQA